MEDLLSGFANSKGAGHGETDCMGKYEQHASEELADLKSASRGAVSGTCKPPVPPTHRTPMHFQQLPHSPLQLVTFPLTKPATSILKWLKQV